MTPTVEEIRTKGQLAHYKQKHIDLGSVDVVGKVLEQNGTHYAYDKGAVIRVSLVRYVSPGDMYYIVVNFGTSREPIMGLVPVLKAKRVLQKEFPGLNLFIHREYTGYDPGWTVSDAVSGCAIITSKTRKEAIEATKRFINKLGLKKFKNWQIAPLELHGYSIPGFEFQEVS